MSGNNFDRDLFNERATWSWMGRRHFLFFIGVFSRKGYGAATDGSSTIRGNIIIDGSTIEGSYNIRLAIATQPIESLSSAGFDPATVEHRGAGSGSYPDR